ncbi:YihY/virulence factor BrkB family protein [Novipirellula caenicola]|uniref:Uncharacterized protein n=1 Tax=Novipirellula caenicola TaxID=1536901 RepID=A0ABP9VU43_9BACT
MRSLFKYIVDAVRQPREELTRHQESVRYAFDLTAHCWRQLVHYRAEGMAAELTYRTIFSLIPVVVLGLVMFRIVGGLEEVQQKVEDQVYSFFGVPYIPEDYIDREPEQDEEPLMDSDASEGQSDFSLSSPAMSPSTPAVVQETTSDSPAQQVAEPSELLSETVAGSETEDLSSDPESDAESRRQARAGIRKALHEATTKIAELDFASIGVIGLVLFIYAAIALANATESIFNLIFEASTHRPVHIRVAIHWSIITLGSGLLAISLYLSGQAVDWFGTLGANQKMVVIASHALSLIASWALLFLLYALMPNTHVSVRAAAIGSFVGALLWQAAKTGFQFYVATALPYSALYGALGLIPLFLFWIYLTWLIFLFGLILTRTLQMMRGRRSAKWIDADDETALHGDPDWMLPMMVEVAEAFEAGKTLDFQQLSTQLGLNGNHAREMAERLVDAKLLRRVTQGNDDDEDDSLTLGRPAHQIEIQEILTLAHHSRSISRHRAWVALREIQQAQHDAMAGRTLASLMSDS